ncbi:MAG: BsuPI-related putative proteinase inhibitor [Peptococcales bacterium]|jgi:hypothetical protein
MEGGISIFKKILKSTTMVGVLCGVLAVLLIGQNANAQKAITATEQSVAEENLETRVNYEIQEGKTVFSFALTNHSNQTKKLQFNSGQQFEVVITDEKGKEVYRYSDGKFFTQALIYQDLKPNQSINWQDTWDMTNKDGQTLTSGNYRAEILILAGAKEKDEKIDKKQLTTVKDFNLLEPVAQGFLPEDAQFIIPQEPEGSNNFVQIELNNDANHEIAVFYKTQGNVGVLILEKRDNDWKLRDKIESKAENLEYAGFADLDGDKNPEVLIGVKGKDQAKQLRIYKLQGDKYTHLYNLDYDRFSVGDLEGDGTLEIASIIRVDGEKPYVKLQVHSLSNNSYKLEQEIKLEDYAYPDNVVIGAAKEGIRGIFVDLGVGAHSAFTEIIIKEDGKYKRALSHAEGDELQPTFKPYPLLSHDINNDGIIEVGIQSMPPETDHLPMVAIPWINNWYQWDGKEALIQKPILQEYSNYGEDYRFIFPDNWSGKITIENKTDDTDDIVSVHFIYLEEDKMRAELLVLNFIPKENWPQEEQIFQNNNRSYVLLGENDKNMLVAELPQDYSKLSGESLKEYKEMLLDREGVKRSFTAIRNYTKMLYDEKGILKSEYAKKAIKETADRLIHALSVKDFECISDFVHPAKGLRFTPYTYVSPEQDVVFNVKEVQNYFKVQEHYLWGYYDGTGEEIFLTPGEYYDEFIYPEDFKNAEKIGYNEVLSFGNMLENQFEIYQDAIVVEYYFPGFNPDYAGLDWRSLRLVFEEYEGNWKLVGLINNQWTI